MAISPLEILQNHEIGSEGGKIDLPSFDMLFKRFVSGDWGSDLKRRPRTPLKAIDHIVQFIILTEKLQIALTREQLCKLVISLLGPFNPPGAGLLQPYKRIQVYEAIAKLEKRSSKMVKTQYIDELEDLYKFHFDYIFNHVLKNVQSPKSIIQLLNTMKNSQFSHRKFAQEAIFQYANINDFGLE